MTKNWTKSEWKIFKRRDKALYGGDPFVTIPADKDRDELVIHNRTNRSIFLLPKHD